MRLLFQHARAIYTLLGLAILVVAFQNCSPLGKNSGDSSGSGDQRMGGQGVDGKMYTRAGICSGSADRVTDVIHFSSDLQTAQYTRQNCVDLAVPKTVPVSSLRFAVNEQSVFVLDNGIFTTATDGSALAPGGSPLFPNLLANYSTRPSWKVAGVDYAVGPHPGTVFRDPRTIQIPGVTLDPSVHEVIVDGDGISLDGYDFSLDGGWTVIVGEHKPAHNINILNSKFKVGANKAPLFYGDDQSTNLYIGYCMFDGNNTPDSLASASMFFTGDGLTVEYSAFQNAPGDFIQAGSGTIVVRYNLFNDNGQTADSAADWLQLGSGDHYIVNDFNTYYQTKATTGSGSSGILVTGQTSAPWTISSAQILSNTIVTLAGAQVDSDIAIGADHLTGTSLVWNNFVDATGSAQFAEPGSSCALGSCVKSASASSIFLNNVDMVTGTFFTNNP